MKMLRYRAKPSKITRLALLNALGNAIALEAPPAIPVLHTQPSPPLPEPLPVPFTPASAKDYYLPSLLARIPGPNFDSAMLASLLRIFARTESWPEFDRTANRFVLRDAQAPLPNWVQQVGTESLNPKVTRNLQGRKGEDRYLAHPKHAPEPDAVVFHTALSHLARREDGWEKAQILWEALGDEELEKDAELVNAYLACAAGSEWPSKTVRLAAEEFGLPDEAWDGQKVEELADVKVVARKHGTKRKAKLDGEAERDGELPVPNLKTLSILLEACLQSGKKSSEVSAKVVGWWRAGRFELGPERGLDDYSGFLLARAIGVALSPSEKSVAEVESAAEKLWVFYTVGTANGLVEPRCPRTAGVVLDACWKAVSSIAATREAVEGGKAARLEIWASRGAEVWKPYEKGVRALTIPGGQKSEGARTMLYLFVGYARLLIDLRFDQRNKDHVARMLTTGLELLRAERGPASLAKIKTIVAATMRKLANEAITDEDACKEYVAEIKATGWWSVDHKWDSRMGRSRGDAAWDRDAGTRSEDESDMRDKKGRRAPQIPSDGFRKVA